MLQSEKVVEKNYKYSTTRISKNDHLSDLLLENVRRCLIHCNLLIPVYHSFYSYTVYLYSERASDRTFRSNGSDLHLHKTSPTYDWLRTNIFLLGTCPHLEHSHLLLNLISKASLIPPLDQSSPIFFVVVAYVCTVSPWVRLQ